MNRENLPLNITEKNRSRVSLLCSIAALFLISIFIHQVDYTLIDKPVIQAQRDAEKAKKEEEKIAAQSSVTSATVVAVGNNIFDTTLYESGLNSDGSYSYDSIYQNVRSEIEAADLALVAQTTVMTTDHTLLSGSPSYLSPAEVSDALVNTGFDVIASASCHADDFGSLYITQTLNIWRDRHPDIPILGIHDTQENAATIQVITVNDIRIALLDYTYGTRNNALSSEEAFMIDTFEKEQVTAAVNKAREQSDCIIFNAHWGDDSASVPNEYQKQWASYLMSLGVNVIIGSHPMSVQPFGTMNDEAGNETTVFYSLGNFVSIQDTIPGLLGGMAKFTIEKTVQGTNTSISIKEKSIEPTIMHYSYATGTYGPYFLKNYTDELAAQNSVTASLVNEEFTVSSLHQTFDTIMSTNVTPSTATDQIDGTGSTQGGTQGSGQAGSTDANGNTYDENGGYYDASGNYYDPYGNVFTANGYYDASGNFFSY